MTYRDTLRKELVDSRVEDCYQALQLLHSSISKLDSFNLAVWNRKSLEFRLNEFAQAEMLRKLY